MIKKTLYITTIILLIISTYLVVDYFTYSNKRNQIKHHKSEQTTIDLKNQIDSILSKIEKEAKRIANLLGENEYNEQQIKTLIKESSLSIQEIQGVTVGYEPNAFSSNKKLFCPYYNKGSQQYMQVEDSYDYTVIGAGTNWYTSVRDNGAKWVEPYFAKAAQNWYVDYGIPFYYSSGANKGKVRGTITMSFIASGFKNLIHSLSIGKTGYGMITSEKGTFLAHPINEYIGIVNLKEIKNKESEKQLLLAYNEILKGNAGSVEYNDSKLNDNILFFYDKIPTSNWGIGLFFYENDLLKDGKKRNRKYIRLALTFSLLLVFLLAIYYNKDYLDKGEIWRLSLFSSILLISNIFLVGYLQHATINSKDEDTSPPIIDMTSLSSFINQQHSRSEELKTPKATSIPTGIYVQRMEFQDSYNINLGGTIWQKYPLNIAEKVNKGFTFPQMSPVSEAAYIEESYRDTIESKEDTEGYLLIGWDFRVTLMLNLKYADFPFDKQHINIKVKPLNNNDHLIFTPDLSSYNYTNPSQKSGLSPKVEISGSKVLESYFNYSIESFDADFGYNNKSLFEEKPVLHYHIYLKRVLLNAFVTYLIPIGVTLIMVFIMILAIGKTEERQGIIESMAAFFFVLIFSHIDLRKEIVTADLIYIEYFYFIAYFMLIITTFNLITYSKNKNKIFDFNNNQIFKAIYFPVFFLVLLIVTLMKFY